MNHQGRRWLNEVCNVRIHGTTGERPIDRMELERQHLQPVRKEEYDICELELRKVHKDCYFSYGRNYYSVPQIYADKAVQVKVYADCLKVIDKRQVVAEYRICRQKRQFRR